MIYMRMFSIYTYLSGRKYDIRVETLIIMGTISTIYEHRAHCINHARYFEGYYIVRTGVLIAFIRNSGMVMFINRTGRGCKGRDFNWTFPEGKDSDPNSDPN